MIKFKIEWLYSDFKAGATPQPENYPIHFTFLLRFPDIEPGDDHVAHFCFNVITSSTITRSFEKSNGLLRMR